MSLAMKIIFNSFLMLPCALLLTTTGCNSQEDASPQGIAAATAPTRKIETRGAFKEGTDYWTFERVRVLDKVAFDKPAEAFSVLIPKGWKSEGNIMWTAPGNTCAGTNQYFKATSPDGKFSFELLPAYLWSWTSNGSLRQMQSGLPTSKYCTYGEPMDAEHYLRNVFASRDLGNPKIVKVTPNPGVVQLMQEANEKAKMEMMRYGAADVHIYPSAVNANLRWSDNTEGIAVCGVTISETIIPNAYNGTYDKQAVTQASNRIVFKFPAGRKDQAERMLSVIMGSFRTNPYWKNVVDEFWKNVREQKQIEHIGKIRMMDEQTRAIGEAAIRQGNARLKAMDAQMRNWERTQRSQDRMHTNFIKMIREVENYRDETGKIELAAGYDHAWSRSDGSSFIMTNDPNFDPSSVFLDPRWKEMKKVH
jgi:hypothetical protein